jgi:hypothetical protein
VDTGPDAWNTTLCESARSHEFTPADVDHPCLGRTARRRRLHGGGVRQHPMAELTLLLVFALYAGVMGLIFQMFGK